MARTGPTVTFFLISLLFIYSLLLFSFFLLLIGISVSVAVQFGTPSRLKLIVSDLRHVKGKNFRAVNVRVIEEEEQTFYK